MDTNLILNILKYFGNTLQKNIVLCIYFVSFIVTERTQWPSDKYIYFGAQGGWIEFDSATSQQNCFPNVASGFWCMPGH